MTIDQAFDISAWFILWLLGMYPTAKFMAVVKIVNPKVQSISGQFFVVISTLLWPFFVPWWVWMDHKFEKERNDD